MVRQVHLYLAALPLTENQNIVGIPKEHWMFTNINLK